MIFRRHCPAFPKFADGHHRNTAGNTFDSNISSASNHTGACARSADKKKVIDTIVKQSAVNVAKRNILSPDYSRFFPSIFLWHKVPGPYSTP